VALYAEMVGNYRNLPWESQQGGLPLPTTKNIPEFRGLAIGSKVRQMVGILPF
jgi:hypothetical protein